MEPDLPLPPTDTPVLTACKGFILFEQHTPTTVYRGRRIYFCLPSCLKAFQEDPKTSCMAGDILQETE